MHIKDVLKIEGMTSITADYFPTSSICYTGIYQSKKLLKVIRIVFRNHKTAIIHFGKEFTKSEINIISPILKSNIEKSGYTLYHVNIL